MGEVKGGDSRGRGARGGTWLLGLVLVAIAGAGIATGASAHGSKAHPERPPAGDEAPLAGEVEAPDIPDIAVRDANGRALRFYSDLVRDRLVVLSFVYSNCKTVCTPIGYLIKELRARLGDGLGARFVSVGIDPPRDTPASLAQWGRKYDPGPDWSMVTGARHDIDRLLEALDVAVTDVEDHPPVLLIGNDRTGRWMRVSALSESGRLAGAVRSLAAEPVADPVAETAAPPPASGSPAALSPAHAYFTDVELVNQHGEPMRLYSDLLRGKTVVVNSFFTHCEDSCPIVMAKIAALQTSLAERVGRDVHLISLSVDPDRDTVEETAEYARRFKARPGWYLLTGSPENLDLANQRLGQYVEVPEGHRNVIIVGNEPTGLWKKALAILGPDELDRLVRDTLDDR